LHRAKRRRINLFFTFIDAGGTREAYACDLRASGPVENYAIQDQLRCAFGWTSVDNSEATMARRPVEADLRVPRHRAREVTIAKIAFSKIDTLHAFGEIFQNFTRKVVGNSHVRAVRQNPIDQITSDKGSAGGNQYSDVFPIHRFKCSIPSIPADASHQNDIEKTVNGLTVMRASFF
jgi:hypothetical protein